jgi:hypothetical protein
LDTGTAAPRAAPSFDMAGFLAGWLGRAAGCRAEADERVQAAA